MKRETKQINKWKVAFFTLFFLNVLVISIVAYFFTNSFSTDSPPQPTPETETQLAEPTFTVVTTKEKVTRLVNDYFAQQLREENVRYAIALDEYVHLHGEIPMLGGTLPITLSCEPIVMEHGDLLFTLKEIAVGKVNLPNKQALRLLAYFLNVPNWVHFDPENEQIYVLLSEIENKHLQFRMQEIDLANDHIVFSIDVKQ